MGLFDSVWRIASKAAQKTFYLGSLYTFFAYFYVEQIKYRLKDGEYAFKKVKQGVDQSADPLGIYLGINQFYVFYMRTWKYRQYQQACLQFHNKIVRTVLKNYESYGILAHRQQMQRQIESNNINPALLKKTLEVKQLNQQILAGATDQFQMLLNMQKLLQTGSILGLTEAEARDIYLIYDYLDVGLFLQTGGNQKYWEFKNTQANFSQKSFNDVLFALAFI